MNILQTEYDLEKMYIKLPKLLPRELRHITFQEGKLSKSSRDLLYNPDNRGLANLLFKTLKECYWNFKRSLKEDFPCMPIESPNERGLALFNQLCETSKKYDEREVGLLTVLQDTMSRLKLVSYIPTYFCSESQLNGLFCDESQPNNLESLSQNVSLSFSES